MADIIIGDLDGISRSISNRRPSHYVFKIESFSMLAKNNIESYESGEFEVGGYKWKLILHPNGNKSKNIDDHISLDLMMVVDGSSLNPGWEVHASFRFFLLDQNNDNYLVIQDTVKTGRRFYGLKLEWGMDRLISLEAFKNPSNGYLVNDTCVFGAEICVCQDNVTGKGEYLTMMKDPISHKHTWKIDNFSKLVGLCQESTTFVVGDHKWRIRMYPKGSGSGAGNSVSLYLALADPTGLPPQTQIHAEYTLRILDQVSSINHKSYKSTRCRWFRASSSDWGWPRFISLSDMNSPYMGYLKNDSCTVEAEVTVHGVAKPL